MTNHDTCDACVRGMDKKLYCACERVVMKIEPGMTPEQVSEQHQERLFRVANANKEFFQRKMLRVLDGRDTEDIHYVLRMLSMCR
jgi:hypothetical protein